MSTTWNWFLIIGGAALVLIEVMLGGFAGFDLVLIGSAFIIGGGLGLLTGSIYTGVIIAGVLCAAYILIGRRYVRERFSKVGGVKSNADAVVGARALVLARMAVHHPGRIRVKGEEWRAVLAPGIAGPIEAGAEVTVDGVDGVTLVVR